MLKLFKKFWIHLLIWGAMLIYFVGAPQIYTRVFTKVGKPLESGSIPAESDRMLFAVDGLEPTVRNGEKVYNLFGWALLLPLGDESVDSLVREVALISDEEKYFFPAIPVHRRVGGLPSMDKLANIQIDADNLGFYAFIADDTIKPGKYRIGLILRNTSSGAAYYRDKPLYYLIKTPNSLELKTK